MEVAGIRVRAQNTPMSTLPAPSPVISSSVRIRLVGTLFTMASLFAAAQIASFTLIAIVATSLSGTEALAGVPSTLSLVGRAAIAYPMGWLMARAGRRPGLVLGLLAGVAGSILSVGGILAGSFWAFAIGVGLTGMARGSSDLGRFAAAEIYAVEQRARVIGFIVFAGTIGAIVGPLLVAPSTRWASAVGLPEDTGPYLLSALFCFLGALLVFLFLRPDTMQVNRLIDPGAGLNTTGAPVSARPTMELLGLPRVRLGTAAMAIGQLVMTMLMVITPLHMSHLGQGTGQISLVIMSHTLGMYGLSSLTGWLIDRTGSPTMIVSGAIILITSAVLSPIVTSVTGIAFAMFLLGLGWNFCFVAGSTVLTSGLQEQEAVRAQGAGDALAAVAAGIGSLSTGLLFARGEMTLVSALCLAVAVALIAATMIGTRRVAAAGGA